MNKKSQQRKTPTLLWLKITLYKFFKKLRTRAPIIHPVNMQNLVLHTTISHVSNCIRFFDKNMYNATKFYFTAFFSFCQILKMEFKFSLNSVNVEYKQITNVIFVHIKQRTIDRCKISTLPLRVLILTIIS